MTLFQLRQSILLLITAIIWGCTFVAQSMGMESVSPFSFTFSRMLLAVVVLTPASVLLRKRLEKTNPTEAARRQTPEYRRTLLWGALSCGLCIFGGEAFQQFGLAFHIEAGKSGFITSLYIVLVPLLGLLLGKRCRKLVWAAVALACAGLWYLCIPENALEEGFTIAAGDIFTLICAFVFSLHILVISHFVTKVNPLELSLGQFAAGSIFAFIAMLLTGLPTIEGLRSALLPILWAGIMSNGIAYTLQIVGQRGMNDTIASLIMSLESVVSVLAGWLMLNQVLSVRELFGCVVMGTAVVLAQLPEKAKKPQKASF